MNPGLSALLLLAYGAAFLVAGLAHGGGPCWLQILNYLVAAVPFALASAHAINFRRRGEYRSRRLANWYLGIGLLIFGYAFYSVEHHAGLIESEELALAPTFEALAAYKQVNGRFPLELRELTPGKTPSVRFTYLYEVRDDAQRFSVGFTHNLTRHHIYDSGSSRWRDVDQQERR